MILQQLNKVAIWGKPWEEDRLWIWDVALIAVVLFTVGLLV